MRHSPSRDRDCGWCGQRSDRYSAANGLPLHYECEVAYEQTMYGGKL